MARKPSGQPHWHSMTIKLPAPLYAELTRVVELQRTTLSDFVRASVTLRLYSSAEASAADRRTSRAVAAQLRRLVGLLDGEEPGTAPGELQSALASPWAPGDVEHGSAVTVPDYDTTRFVLGAKLCPGKHAWGNTGKTLLTIKGKKCVACQTARQKARREERRRAQGVEKGRDIHAMLADSSSLATH
jgi:hypothetical protein